MKSASMLVAVSFLLHAWAAAQSRPAKEPAFEVASVKVNKSGARQTGAAGFQPGGRFQVVNGTARLLIAYGYNPGAARVVGLPPWAETERFDVMASAPASADTRTTEMRAMIRDLLVKRFQLKAHFEEREEATYSMVMVNKDRLGPQISKVDFNCDELVEAVGEGRITLADVPKARNGLIGCASAARTTKKNGATVITAQSGGLSLSALAESLRNRAGRSVLDKTGLQGFYEYTMEYSDDPSATGSPSFFAALSEQLGLRIVPDRGMVRVLVVERIERPTTN